MRRQPNSAATSPELTATCQPRTLVTVRSSSSRSYRGRRWRWRGSPLNERSRRRGRICTAICATMLPHRVCLPLTCACCCFSEHLAEAHSGRSRRRTSPAGLSLRVPAQQRRGRRADGDVSRSCVVVGDFAAARGWRGDRWRIARPARATVAWP